MSTYFDLVGFNPPKLNINIAIGLGGIWGLIGSIFSVRKSWSTLTKYPFSSSMLNLSLKNTASGLSTLADLLTGLF